MSKLNNDDDEDEKIIKIQKMINLASYKINIFNYSQILKKKISTKYNKIITIRKDIINRLLKIMNIQPTNIVDFININKVNNIFNEKKFHRLIKKGYDYIANFRKDYKIKKLFVEPDIFQKIINDYQSFNYSVLIKINLYLTYFNKIQLIYKNFIPIYNQIEILNNTLKQQEMLDDDNDPAYIEDFYPLFENCADNFNRLLDEFRNSIKRSEINSKKLMARIKKLEKDNEMLKKESNENKTKIKELEKNNSILKNVSNDNKIKIKRLEKDNAFLKKESNENKAKIKKLEKDSEIPKNVSNNNII